MDPITLSPRQLECLRLRCRLGLNGPQIANRLSISQQTVRDHLSRAYRALCANGGTVDALVCYRLGMAEAAGILDPPVEEMSAMRTWQV